MSARFWIIRFVSLSIGFELTLGLIFASIYGTEFMEDVKKIAILGAINMLIITALFFLIKRNISNIHDDNQNDQMDDTPPEKDLSYFR